MAQRQENQTTIQHLLLDLDGTLLDSKEGIFRCINHALVELGSHERAESELIGMIGPPLYLGFPQLLGTAESSLIERAISLYRERYRDVGIFEAQLFPGIASMVAELSALGYDLFVVTAKPKPYADQLVAHFGLDNLFHHVYGPEFSDLRDGKAHLIRDAIDQYQLEVSGMLMVGDRDRDVLSAKEHGVRSAGALWGYGSAAELSGCGADNLVSSPEELMELVMSTGASRGSGV